MRKVLERNVGLIIYLVVWAALFCWFWLGKSALEGNEMVYSLIAFYVLLPASALVVSVMYGAGESRVRFIVPVILGGLEGLLEFLTFNLANAVANGKWSGTGGFSWELCLFSMVPSLIGVIIGGVSRHLKRK